jgi:hypothetical protein
VASYLFEQTFGVSRVSIPGELLILWVHGIHAKYGLFPTDPKKLDEEVIIGKGKVDFPTVLKQLKQVNYRGSRNIERQIGGDQQRKDILDSKIFLQNLIAKAYSQGLLFSEKVPADWLDSDNPPERV